MTPRFSVVVPLCEPQVDALRELVESLRSQTIPDWELVVVGSELEAFPGSDDRIRVIDGEIGRSRAAVADDGIAAARGAFIAIVQPDDLLEPDALECVADVIEVDPEVDFIYSDEDEFRKPDWSPERLRGQPYTGQLAVFRADLLGSIGGFRDGFDGAEDHDLALRAGEVAAQVAHARRTLIHRRSGPVVSDAGLRAVQDHLDRVGAGADAEFAPGGDAYCVRWRQRAGDSVSVVIPTIGSSAPVWGEPRTLVTEAVRCLLAEAGDYDLEVVVVYDPPTPEPVLDELRDLASDRLLLVPFTEEFNFSRKMNVGVLHSRGDYVVALNDDVATREPGWLAQLLGPLADPSVGMTGARLHYETGQIQHVGHAYAWNEYLHPSVKEPADTPGYFGTNDVSHEVSGVTGACLAMRRETYLEVGGFAEMLPNNFNDVDLCMKTRQAGYRIVYVANCELFHFESLSRQTTVAADELDVVRWRWGQTQQDAYFPELGDENGLLVHLDTRAHVSSVPTTF